ncbi:MAG TPA: PilZ domain-containing protein [Sphingomicrobium sp.]|nr:PilZ domain-containing protein [Sphingomicrobium sp.]
MGTYDRKLHETVRGFSPWIDREMRYATAAMTTITTSDGRSASAKVLNVSNKGCRIRTSLPLKEGERLTFVVEPHGMVEAKVCWLRESEAGVKVITRDPFYRDYSFAYPP